MTNIMNQTIFELLGEDLSFILALAVFSFLLAILLTPAYTRFAFKNKWWKGPRTLSITGEKSTVVHQLENSHKHKRQLPTMAGIVMLTAIAITTLSFNWTRSQTYLPLVAMLGAGLVGLVDDMISLRSKGTRSKGMNFKIKFSLIMIVAVLGGLYFYYKLGYNSIHLTFFGDIYLGLWLIPLFAFVIIASANAVNITDGLDGLSGGLLASAYGSYAVIALMQGQLGIAGFCLTVVGALFAYVWFNIFPARFMMGDVGSFALGTGLGAVAMLTDTVPLLIVIGGVFVLETGSSVIQILSKKLRAGKKVFQAAPIHHHFVALGWPETKVTMRFWILGQILAVTGVIFAVLGGHI